MTHASLPIDAALPELTAALRAQSAAVLVAPPGAGKTTRVPLVLAREAWAAGKKILVLEPRRLAARAAAARMAATLGEAVGATVGYRVRFGSKVSRATRIEVVTEGIFTRLVLDDPSLAGVAAVLFDEFHERSLDADLGLALARDVQQGLREDLKLLVMSATLDGARVGRLLGDAPVIESAGRAFPVETRYLGRDAPRADRAAGRRCGRCAHCAAMPDRCWSFFPAPPKSAAPRPCCASASPIPRSTSSPLYGALEADVQDRAIAPAPPGRRKVVLATSIAETSLTIEGVRVVIDCGLARVPRYEPDVGPDQARDRARVARLRRPAARPRRPHRARHLLPAVGRAADRLARSRQPAGNPRRRFVRLRARSRPLGRRRSRIARLPRSAAGAGAGGSKGVARASSARSTATAASPRREDGCATCRCRRGSRAWWSMRQPPARPSLPPRSPSSSPSAASAATTSISAIASTRCAAIARGRARDARAMAKRWAEIAKAQSLARRKAAAPPVQVTIRSGGACWRSPIPTALPGTAAPAAPFCWPMAAARMSIRRRRWRASRSSPSPRSRGTAAQGRIVLAAPLTLGEIEAQFADRIESRDEIVFDEASASPARAPPAPSRRDRARRAADEGRAQTMRPRACSREGIARLGIDTAAVDEAAAAMARPGDVPAQRGRRRMAGPLRCRARRHRSRLARARAGRQDRALRAGQRRIRRRRCTGCCRGLCAAGSKPRLPPISPRRRDRRCRSITRRRRGPSLRSACRSCSGSTAIPPLRRPGAARGRAAVAGASAGAGDARPAGLLARQLCCGQSRDERPLSAPSLARRSAGRGVPPAAPSRARFDAGTGFDGACHPGRDRW